MCAPPSIVAEFAQLNLVKKIIEKMYPNCKTYVLVSSGKSYIKTN